MKRRGGAPWLVVALMAASVLQVVYYYPRLPERVASHFGAGGAPDGWSSRAALCWIYAVTMVITAALFLGIGALVSRLPPSLINLPNKDVWLAAERREETLRVITSYFGWFGAATLLFLLITFELLFRANLGPSPRLSGDFIGYLVAYMVFAVAGTVWLLLRFSRKPQP